MGHGDGNLASGQIRVCLSSLPKSGIHLLKLEVECHCILTRNQACIHWLKIELAIIQAAIGGF